MHLIYPQVTKVWRVGHGGCTTERRVLGARLRRLRRRAPLGGDHEAARVTRVLAALTGRERRGGCAMSGVYRETVCEAAACACECVRAAVAPPLRRPDSSHRFRSPRPLPPGVVPHHCARGIRTHVYIHTHAHIHV